MSSRNTKSHANKKISTNTPKKEAAREKKGRKKKQESVVSQPSQIITEFLNDDVSNIMGDNISNDDSFNDDDISDNNDVFNDNESVAQDFTTTQGTESNSQNKLMLNSRCNNHNQDNFISSNRIASSRLMSIPDSREDSPILYRSTLALELRNKIDLNRASEIVSNSRVNSQFDYVSLNNTSRSRPISSLRSRNNAMNILRNDTHDAETNSIHHFDITNKVVPSSLNKMMIYQLCSWLCENPKKSVFEELVQKVFKCELNSTKGIEWLHTANRYFGDFRNKLVNS
ncbi:33478_t:CDS:2, partial [Racocetra persica]